MSAFDLLIKIKSLCLQHTSKFKGEKRQYYKTGGCYKIRFMQAGNAVAEYALQWRYDGTTKDHHDQE